MRVMNDLREAIDCFLEPGVVAMDEDKDLAPGGAGDPRIEIAAYGLCGVFF